MSIFWSQPHKWRLVTTIWFPTLVKPYFPLLCDNDTQHSD